MNDYRLIYVLVSLVLFAAPVAAPATEERQGRFAPDQHAD